MDNTIKKIEEYMNSFISPKDRLDELIKKYSLDKKGESYIFRSVKRLKYWMKTNLISLELTNP